MPPKKRTKLTKRAPKKKAKTATPGTPIDTPSVSASSSSRKPSAPASEPSKQNQQVAALPDTEYQDKEPPDSDVDDEETEVDVYLPLSTGFRKDGRRLLEGGTR